MLIVCGGALGMVIGVSVGVRMSMGLTVVACLSLSSAPLARRFIDDSVEVVGHLNGLLVMQDIQLGTLVALIPLFADRPASVGGWNIAALFYGFLQLLQTLLLGSLGNRPEAVLLGSVAVCFLLLLVADYLGASMELGCFLAGLAIGSQGHSIVEQVKRLVEPLRDFLSLFFFASLGEYKTGLYRIVRENFCDLMANENFAEKVPRLPDILRSEFSMILGVTFCVLVVKFLLSLLVLGVFTGHCHTSTWLLSLSLSSVSEFSFLLTSRARRLGIISREVPQ
ncbi:Transmembrane and coiled-coil domain-containing protein 3 [Geodia barretti]|uniref:Transmembrane and coiled-coil domain-containing protein 3 n=1 Tax=Geodia barretti TaxID=519541 RepID=A0AA35QWP2_GEOBA|nr:Transmembrane and coiled-coil domain-containing protein 3 [Geodia barretti]